MPLSPTIFAVNVSTVPANSLPNHYSEDDKQYDTSIKCDISLRTAAYYELESVFLGLKERNSFPGPNWYRSFCSTPSMVFWAFTSTTGYAESILKCLFLLGPMYNLLGLLGSGPIYSTYQLYSRVFSPGMDLTAVCSPCLVGTVLVGPLCLSREGGLCRQSAYLSTAAAPPEPLISQTQLNTLRECTEIPTCWFLSQWNLEKRFSWTLTCPV